MTFCQNASQPLTFSRDCLLFFIRWYVLQHSFGFKGPAPFAPAPDVDAASALLLLPPPPVAVALTPVAVATEQPGVGAVLLMLLVLLLLSGCPVCLPLDGERSAADAAAADFARWPTSEMCSLCRRSTSTA